MFWCGALIYFDSVFFATVSLPMLLPIAAGITVISKWEQPVTQRIQERDILRVVIPDPHVRRGKG